VRALAPWSDGRLYLNFTEEPVDPAAAYAHDAWRRLQAVRAGYDPAGLFRANHEIPLALPVPLPRPGARAPLAESHTLQEVSR
jgi:hypothetical protein